MFPWDQTTNPYEAMIRGGGRSRLKNQDYSLDTRRENLELTKTLAYEKPRSPKGTPSANASKTLLTKQAELPFNDKATMVPTPTKQLPTLNTQPPQPIPHPQPTQQTSMPPLTIQTQPAPKLPTLANNSLLIPSMLHPRNKSEEKAKYAEELNTLVRQYETKKQAAKQREQQEDLKLQQELVKHQPYGQDRLRLLQRVTNHITKPVAITLPTLNTIGTIQSQNTLNGYASLGAQQQPNHQNYQQGLHTGQYNGQSQTDHRINTGMQNQSVGNGVPQSLIQSQPTEQRLRTQQQNGQLAPQDYYQAPQQMYLSMPPLDVQPRTTTRMRTPFVNPAPGLHLSTYDQNHSYMHKQEKSNLLKQLNQINESYLKQLLEQVPEPNPPMEGTIPTEQPDDSDQREQQRHSDLEQQRLTGRQRDEQRQQELLREQQRLQEQLTQQQQEAAQREEELRRQLQEHQKPTANSEIQTLQSDTFYEDKMNQYVSTLKELSNQVIQMKNHHTDEQLKLNHHLITLRQHAQRDYEEKLRLQAQLTELERRQQANRLWEGEHQRQLMQAIQKNQPVPNYTSVPLDYRTLNPKVSRIVHFKDESKGYEYEEQPDMMYRSHLVPVQDGQRSLPRSIPTQVIQTPQLNYTTEATRAMQLNDVVNPYYDYSYDRQNRQPGNVRHAAYQPSQPNAEGLLLENDRRLYELEKLYPNEDREMVAALYRDKLL